MEGGAQSKNRIRRVRILVRIPDPHIGRLASKALHPFPSLPLCDFWQTLRISMRNVADGMVGRMRKKNGDEENEGGRKDEASVLVG